MARLPSPPLPRRLALAACLGWLSACSPGAQPREEVAASVAPAQSAEPVASARSVPAPEPPSPEAIAVAAGACTPGADVGLYASPERLDATRPVRVVAIAHRSSEPPDGLVAVPASGPPTRLATSLGLGPPASLRGTLTEAPAGKLRLVAHRAERVLGCVELEVHEAPLGQRRAGGRGAWRHTRAWTSELEDYYAAWVEALFAAPEAAQPSYAALHELTQDSSKNLLFDHWALDEDAALPRGLRLDPDCADLPYFLRAYFAAKLGLPFAFSSCTRGQAGQAPKCLKRRSSLEPMDDPPPDRVRRLERFLRVTLKDTVHSGTGRTLATDDFTDYYATRLDLGALRPGSIYADPYGHILVVAGRVPQTKERAGVLFAVDGQPDGTVARKRFWRGNFLFAVGDPALGHPGFKRFRPAVIAGAEVTLRTNAELAADPGWADHSLEQTSLDPTRFYDRMDELISPEPLDPRAASIAAIDALEEQLGARVTSVENGEAHFARGGGRIDMPKGASIFETVGDWENYSTPSRDLRLLIAIDVVRGFAVEVERRPARFGLSAGPSVEAAVREVAALTKSETEKRRIRYRRSDGSEQVLSLAELVARREALEMAYNPNDCVEKRWGAAEGSAEAASCRRRAPADQRRAMERVRDWFRDRRRPPRG